MLVRRQHEGAYAGRTVYTPANPGGRQPLFAHEIQTTNGLRRPSSAPVRAVAISVETDLPHATQVAISDLFSLAFSLGIAGPFHLAPNARATDQTRKTWRAFAPSSLIRRLWLSVAT